MTAATLANALLPTEDLITHLFCLVDDTLNDQQANILHPQSAFYPSEAVTLGLLFALKGQGPRLFYRCPSTDGSADTTYISFSTYLSAPGSSDDSTPIVP